MARDGSSGGVIRLVIIDKTGVEKECILGKEKEVLLPACFLLALFTLHSHVPCASVIHHMSYSVLYMHHMSYTCAMCNDDDSSCECHRP